MQINPPDILRGSHMFGWPKQQAVDQVERGCVQPQPDAEREHDHHGKPRLTTYPAPGKLQILAHTRPPFCSPLARHLDRIDRAQFIPSLLHITKLLQRSRTRGAARQTLANQFVSPAFNVKVELVLDLPRYVSQTLRQYQPATHAFR